MPKSNRAFRAMGDGRQAGRAAARRHNGSGARESGVSSTNALETLVAICSFPVAPVARNGRYIPRPENASHPVTQFSIPTSRVTRAVYAQSWRAAITVDKSPSHRQSVKRSPPTAQRRSKALNSRIVGDSETIPVLTLMCGRLPADLVWVQG
jgi:hypothetical protein